MNPLPQTIVEPTLPPAVLGSPIGQDLAEVERVLAHKLASPRPHVARLVAHLGHYRGKRLRPTLLLLTARASGLVKPAHHVLGAVVEMIHTATLVHDDILDDARMRRHVPTVNAAWSNHDSVLLGDFLFTHAFHLTATLGSALACEIIGDATNRVCEGELQQVGEQGNLDLSEEDYLDIVDGKTAALTACCCRLGALFSEAEPEVVESLSRFGRYLGIAFQIADDMLDLAGEERKTGKTLGTDLQQKKLTLPLIRLLQTVSPSEADDIRRILTKPDPSQRTCLNGLIQQSEAIEYARCQAEVYAGQARVELGCLPASEYRGILEGLTYQVVIRSR